MSVLGIHHVTAISGKIETNLDFYTRVLGLRLVKKTVNQDDVKAYHLFYADTIASPGTDLTFFDWPGIPVERPGASTVALTSLRVSSTSLDFWERRLTDAGITPRREENRILFKDPEGLSLALVADDGLPGVGEPWTEVVSAENALKGFLGLDLESSHFDGTRQVLVDLLGFVETSPGQFEVRTADSIGRVSVHASSDRRGHSGAGGVHHVAFRAKDDDHLEHFKQAIERAGFQTSGFVNRYYFHSLYFREPGGVLFEIATDGPGMDGDEDPKHLGERLSLPSFLEPRRQAIESGLKPIPEPYYLQPR